MFCFLYISFISACFCTVAETVGPRKTPLVACATLPALSAAERKMWKAGPPENALHRQLSAVSSSGVQAILELRRKTRKFSAPSSFRRCVEGSEPDSPAWKKTDFGLRSHEDDDDDFEWMTSHRGDTELTSLMHCSACKHDINRVGGLNLLSAIVSSLHRDSKKQTVTCLSSTGCRMKKNRTEFCTKLLTFYLLTYLLTSQCEI